jgi:MFS family permease
LHGRSEPRTEDDITQHAAARGETTEQAAKTTFRDVFGVPEFRALWLAQLLSVIGDQLARVALTILVYDRTHSAFLAAVTFVTSIVPVFLGGVTLAWIADRYPRRSVMIACDLARCVLVLVMAIRGVPLVGLVALLFVVTLIGAPFSSARAAIYPDVLDGDRYVMGTAITLTTNQFAQVIGFAAGGAIVGFLGIRTSLVADAVTYAASALLVRAWVGSRPAANPGAGVARVGLGNPLPGMRLVFGTPALRIPMLFGLLMAFHDSPEGVSTPLAASLGGGAVTVGLLLAAQTFGASVGALGFGRMVSAPVQNRLTGPLAIGACGVLALFALSPQLPGALAILAVSGLLTCFQLSANAAFVRATPPEQRSQAFGLAQGGISFGQGVTMLAAGGAAEAFAPADVIAVCGAVGAFAAGLIALSRASMNRRSARQRTPEVRDHQVQLPVRMAALLPSRGLPTRSCHQVQLPVRILALLLVALAYKRILHYTGAGLPNLMQLAGAE